MCILLTTDLSMLCINFFGSAHVVFSKYFGEKEKRGYYLEHLKYLLVNGMILLITYLVSSLILDRITVQSILLKLIIQAALCFLFPPVVYWVVYRRTNQFLFWKDWMGKLKKEISEQA